MSGGGAALGSGGGKAKRGSSKRKKTKRVGFSLDMTPLVDITFLLLTFFMFTTTMAAPQALDMTIPPEIDVEVEVRESELLSIFVRADNKLFWAKGSEDPKPLTLKEVKALSTKENLDPAVKNKLIVALKTSKDASYGLIVQILDQLNLAEGVITTEIAKELDANGQPTARQRRFTIALLTDDEVTKLEGAQ
ncbi:MAG: biopolymer transporter ExbD [Ignavibacteria bacterium]|jgi:biopolymer transport protein ExbD|nr:biopolymer transporter ExbD [Ignavibacteria bacterium]